MNNLDESKKSTASRRENGKIAKSDLNLGLKTHITSSNSTVDDEVNQTAIESSSVSDRKDSRRSSEEESVHDSEESDSRENTVKEKSTRKENLTDITTYTTSELQHRPLEETFKHEAEENEHFDPHFYKNLVAIRQHDQTKRLCETLAERNQRDSETGEIKVLAKVVDDNDDHIEAVLVKQTGYIGSGVFSDVYKGYVLRAGQSESDVKHVAIKKIWPDPSREDRQIGVHRLLKHPNIARLLLYFVCIHPTTRVASWTLVMDLMPSTVGREQSNCIERGLLLPQIYVKLWMFQTMSALGYMEKSRISHRDIKPENLLVDYNFGTLKVGDFGSAKIHKPGDTSNSYQVTRYYRAPELCFGYTKYDATVDVWSAGCILAELLTNRIIFYGRSNADQLRKIIRIIGTPTMRQLSACIPGHYVSESIFKKKYPPVDLFFLLSKYNKTITRECISFISGILRYETHERLRGKKALDHPYFNSLRIGNGRLPNGCPLPPLYYP
uniref:Protein kinase domain-containing protein n=3 Tax=Parascaris univalens TaxID=6257 RepID=A0A915BMJ7_PARUN